MSGNLIVQLVTEDLNRRWFETHSGHQVVDIQRQIRHPALSWMGATLDGRVEATGAVFESKFMLPWSFSEEAAVEKHAPQLQHNLWVVSARTAVLSVITGGGKWVEINDAGNAECWRMRRSLRRVSPDATPALEQAFNDDERARLRGEPPRRDIATSLRSTEKVPAPTLRRRLPKHPCSISDDLVAGACYVSGIAQFQPLGP